METESAFNDYKTYTENLTNQLIPGNSSLIDQIQKISSPSSNIWEHLDSLITQLIKEKKFYDAIVWCQIIPRNCRYYLGLNRKGLDALLQLKFNIDHSNEKDKEVTFPSNHQPQEVLSYQETLFKFAWKIALESKEPYDLSLALHYLAEISGKSGLDNHYANASIYDAEVLIQYARNVKESIIENKRMTEQTKQLQPLNTKVSHLSVFNKVFNTSSLQSAKDELVVRKKRQRRLSL